MAVLLIESDILSIYDNLTYNESNTVIPKIIGSRQDKRIINSHIIDPSNFDVIYATSDIHSDYSNFINYACFNKSGSNCNLKNLKIICGIIKLQNSR